jgi:hypothetical protein
VSIFLWIMDAFFYLFDHFNVCAHRPARSNFEQHAVAEPGALAVRQTAEKQFETHDTDRDGFLSLAEMRALVHACYPNEDWDDRLWSTMLADLKAAQPNRGP